MSRHKAWMVLLVVGSAAAVAGAAAGIGEITIRWRERHRPDVPGTAPTLFYQHARLRHALVRDFDYYGWMRVNPQGFRGRRETREQKPSGTVRIMTVGSSTTFDSFVTADERAWPARLEHWLSQSAPRCTVEVLNAGVPGYRMLDQFIRLQMELYRYQADLLILYEAHNDLALALNTYAVEGRPTTGGDPRRPDQLPTTSSFGRWLGQHSLLYGKLALHAKILTAVFRGREAARKRPMTDAEVAQVIARAAAAFERDVASYLAVGRALGIAIVMPEITHVSGAMAEAEPDSAIRGQWRSAYPVRSVESVLAAYREFAGAARRAAERFAARYIPTADFGLRGLEWYVPDDPVHFSDAGADRMGRELAARLVGSGTFEPGTCRVRPAGQ